MIYLLNLNIYENNVESFNASNKAIKDVTQTFKRLNYKILTIHNRRINIPQTNKEIAFTSKLNFYFQLYQLLFIINKNDIVYIQYQCDSKIYDSVIRILKRKKCKIFFIVHDLYSIRYNTDTTAETNRLNKVDMIFVHTNSMKQLLGSLGVKKQMDYFNLFDYYSDDECISINELLKLKKIIAFAGNLQKSEFISSLVKVNNIDDIKFHLFGKSIDLNLINCDHIKYVGVFNPNKPGILKAGWGLVWDGNSIDSCSGCLGEYLKINSSHKISLYLACGIPVIIWKESSLSKWIESNHLGIIIDSLLDIPSIINTLSDNQYQDIINHVRLYSYKLRSGDMLSNVIEKYNYK